MNIMKAAFLFLNQKISSLATAQQTTESTWHHSGFGMSHSF